MALATREAGMTIRRALSDYAIFIALAAECLILGLAAPAFFTPDNFANVLRQNAFPAIIAAGMTFAILTAGIDLSVGSVVGLSGVLCADALVHGWGLGLSIARRSVGGRRRRARQRPDRDHHPRAAVHRHARDDARGARRRVQIHRRAHDFRPAGVVLAPFSQGWSMAAVMAVVFAVSWILLMRTPFGRHVYATGGNREAAWLSGIRVNRVLVKVYALCGLERRAWPACSWPRA